MLQVLPTERSVGTPTAKQKVEPPILSGGSQEHPVFGRQPHAEKDLKRQNILVLSFYYWKAINLLKNADSVSTDRNMLIQARGAAYEARVEARANTTSEIARQMEVIAAEMKYEDSVSVIGINEFSRIAKNLAEITEPPRPQKFVGKLKRGCKLTRAGLLHRYHAFLVGELHTVSWNLYGSRDYATSMVPFDHEVTKRTSEHFHNGKPLPYRRGRKSYPFFDESKLTDRARSVLKSLKINTERAER